MTPLMRFWRRLLGPRWAPVAVTLSYAVMLLGVLFSLGSPPPDIMYVNVPALQEAP